MRSGRACRILCAVVVLGAGGCAKQGFPPGGPEDRMAPEITASEPESGSTRVPLDAAIILTFSEGMQKSVSEGAVSLFPPAPGGVILRWHGPRLEIAPDTAWAPAQTYVLTVQAEARDLHNNRLAHSRQIAFSTGSRIDSGMVAGSILRDGRAVPGATALCYRVPGAGANPERDTADYVVQADSLGRFQFAFLGPGAYRIFGLDDRDRDWLWNIGVEAIGVPAQDVELGGAQMVALLPPLLLTPLDTAAPQILDCRMPAPGFVEIDCSQGLDSSRLSRQKIRLASAGDTGVALTLFAQDSTAKTVYARLPAEQAAGRLPLQAEFEHPGSGLRSRDSCTFDIQDRWEPAGTEPSLRVEPDSATTARSWSPEVRLRFAVPVADIAGHELEWRSGSTSGRAACSLSSPFTLALTVPESTDGGGPLDVEVPVHFIRWCVGGAWPTDSVHDVHVPFPFRDSAGRYELKVEMRDEPDWPSTRVGLRPVGGGATLWSRRGPAGTIEGSLASGDYVLYLFVDRDGDRHREAGWPSPFRASEPLWPLDDTLHVRARFTTELTVPARPKKQLP